MLADLFNKCFKETYFPDCWKVSSVVPMFKNVWKRSVTKNSHPLGFYLVLVVSLNEDFDLNSLNWFAFSIAVGFLLVFFDILYDCSMYFTRFSISFFVSRLWSVLPADCFPLPCNQNAFRSRFGRHCLSLGFFN